MRDLIFLGLGFILFLLAGAYARACSKL